MKILLSAVSLSHGDHGRTDTYSEVNGRIFITLHCELAESEINFRKRETGILGYVWAIFCVCSCNDFRRTEKRK